MCLCVPPSLFAHDEAGIDYGSKALRLKIVDRQEEHSLFQYVPGIGAVIFQGGCKLTSTVTGWTSNYSLHPKSLGYTTFEISLCNAAETKIVSILSSQNWQVQRLQTFLTKFCNPK